MYGIKPKTVRQKHGTPKGYDAAQFEDAFARYLASPLNLPQRRNDPPEVSSEITGVVADEPQQSLDAATALIATPLLDCGEVGDKTPASECDPDSGVEDPV